MSRDERPDVPDLKERRRAIQRAIRRREDPPPGLEDLAMQVALRQSGLRWFVVLYAIGFVVEVVSAFVENSVAAQVRDGLIALAFLLVGRLQWQIGQRAKEAVDRWSPQQEQGKHASDA
jgi:hypothetical protein